MSPSSLKKVCTAVCSSISLAACKAKRGLLHKSTSCDYPLNLQWHSSWCANRDTAERLPIYAQGLARNSGPPLASAGPYIAQMALAKGHAGAYRPLCF